MKDSVPKDDYPPRCSENKHRPLGGVMRPAAKVRALLAIIQL